MVGKTAVHDDHLGRDVDQGGGDGAGVDGGDDHDDDFEESDHGDVDKTALHDNHLGLPVLQLVHDPGLQEEVARNVKIVILLLKGQEGVLLIIGDCHHHHHRHRHHHRQCHPPHLRAGNEFLLKRGISKVVNDMSKSGEPSRNQPAEVKFDYS